VSLNESVIKLFYALKEDFDALKKDFDALKEDFDCSDNIFISLSAEKIQSLS
jgi:sulfate adenylyltransferase subunit 1 (EFTu-like GTPase family)